MRRVDLRCGLYAYLLQDRTELVPELACGILRVPHIDNTEAALSLSGDVSQKSFDGPILREWTPFPSVSFRTVSS